MHAGESTALYLGRAIACGLSAGRPFVAYRLSSRSFPDMLPAVEYSPGDNVRKVDSDGFISFRNKPLRISKAFRGQYVALRPTVEDGVFAVHYCAHKIFTLDLRQSEEQDQQLQPVGD